MLATYACAAGICGLSLGAGMLVCRLGGASGWSWLAPGAGLATVLCAATLTVRLPGHGWTALAVLVALAVAGALVRPRREPQAASPGGGAGLVEALVVAAILIAALSIPFLLNGRFGLLGAGNNDDLGFHLAWAEALANGSDADRLIAQLDPGYPIGPHSTAAALARPFGVLEAFSGLMIAVPILTALTSLTALGDLRPGWRVAAASATGLPYMAAAYFGAGTFKEPILALLVLVFVLALAQLRPPVSWRSALVPVLASLAAVLTFGANGLVWPLGIAAAWLAAELIARRQDWLSWLRGMAPALLAAAGLLALGALVQLGRLEDASVSGGLPSKGSEGGGNFVGQISPWPILGGWPAGDFRFEVAHEFWAVVFAAIAAATVAYALIWWTRRRELALPSAVAVSLLIYLLARSAVPPYHSAKAMVVAAPIITLLGVRAMFAGLPGPERPSLLARSGGGAARALLGIGFLAVLAASSLAALYHAPVSAKAHSDELRSLRPLLRGGPTILLSRQNYARWELSDVRIGTVYAYGFEFDVPVGLRAGKPFWPADFDSLTAKGLDRFRYAVTVRGRYGSDPPANWRLVRRTDSFEVWERRGPTPPRTILDEGVGPGAVLDCSSPRGRRLSRSPGVAAVRRPPVVGGVDRWRWPNGERPYVVPRGGALVSPGGRQVQELRLPRGRWDIALQYASLLSLRVRAADLDEEAPAATEPLANYWRIGSLRSRGGPVRVEVEVSESPLGVPGRNVLLGKVVATRAGWRAAEVPLRKACGRYVDWVRLG